MAQKTIGVITWVDNLISAAKQKLARTTINAARNEIAANYQQALLSEARGDDLKNYRRLSSLPADALNPINHDSALMLMRYLYYANPLARRLIEIPVDFNYHVEIKADEAAHPDLQKVLDNFWLDPYNDLEGLYPQLVERWGMDGELCLPVEVNPQTGQVHLQYREPSDIKEIHVFAKDKRYVETVVLNGDPGKKDIPLKAIRYEIDPSATFSIGEAEMGNQESKDAYGFRVGECFYFRQCHLITGRGRPPLETIIDWLDAHDRTFFDQLRNIALQDAFVYDLLMQGANKEAIEAKILEFAQKGPPRAGSIYVHNESETLEAKTPKISPQIANTIMPETRKVIGLGSGGRPAAWMGAEQDVNRSTAEVADGPPLKNLERSQWTLKRMIEFMVNFSIDMAILHGTLPPEANEPEAREFKVVSQDLSQTDNAQMAKALADLENALSQAVENEHIDLETARMLFYQTAGTEMPRDLEEKIAANRQAKKEQDYQNNPAPQLPSGSNTPVMIPSNGNGNGKGKVKVPNG